jgi:hypothetical protein
VSWLRLDTTVLRNPKVRKLLNRLGATAVVCLLRVWVFCAESRTNGALADLDDQDVEHLVAEWEGDSGVFVAALIDLRLLERNSEGVLQVHDWTEHQPFLTTQSERSQRNSELAKRRWAKYHSHADSDANARADGNATGIAERTPAGNARTNDRPNERTNEKRALRARATIQPNSRNLGTPIPNARVASRGPRRSLSSSCA